jgi:hypothetical protein
MQGIKCFAAAAATSLPFSVLPVKHIPSNLDEERALATSIYPSMHV